MYKCELFSREKIKFRMQTSAKIYQIYEGYFQTINEYSANFDVNIHGQNYQEK